MIEKTKRCSTSSLKSRIAASRDRLYRVALAWCGDEMLADDLAQETMAAGIINNQQLRDENRLFAWLYSIMNNQWYRHLQRNKRHDELDEYMPSEDPGPSSNCQQLEMVSRVRRAVATLPMQQRQVISLVDLEGFSYCDVARVLDIPIGTVMSRLHSARQNLLSRLERVFPRSTATKGHMRLVE